MERITANGLSMPRLGLGTYGMQGRVCQAAVEAGLAMGYRHIDTGEMYTNEDAIGAALAASAVKRDEIHITTKVWTDHLTPERMRAAMDASLRALRIDEVDLYLIHWPSPQMDLRAALAGLAALQRDGRARRIGVANFSAALLRRAVEEFGAAIAAEQFEFHAMLRQPPLLAYLRERGIPVIAYSPLAKGLLTQDATLRRIAARHGATPAQVALRWLLDQPDVAVIPKSSRAAGLRENLGALELRLDEADRAAIEALPKDRRRVSPGFAPAWDATGERLRGPRFEDQDRQINRWAEPALLRLDRLDRLETLEFRMPQIERPVGAGAGMGGAERLRARPGLELRARAPDRVRGVEHMVLRRRTAQQVKLDETRNVAQMRVAAGPDPLELRLRARLDPKPIHGDEHPDPCYLVCHPPKLTRPN